MLSRVQLQRQIVLWPSLDKEGTKERKRREVGEEEQEEQGDGGLQQEVRAVGWDAAKKREL